MPEQPGAGRLDPETLAAYIDGLLPPEERAKVEAEIAADPETYEWLVNTIQGVDDEAIVATAAEAAPVTASDPGAASPPPTAPRPPLPFHRRRSVQGVMGTLLAAAAALVMVVRTQPAWWQGLWGPAIDTRFAKLVEAVGEERYIEARLTGGFKYGPMRQVMRGPGDLSNQNLQLLAAAGELQKAAEKDPNIENLHAWGVAQLLLGNSDGAVRSLGQAFGLASSGAVAVDLAAAYLARNAADGATADPVLALKLLDESVAGALTAEGLFNRALAFERIGDSLHAREAWTTYVAAETDERWRVEARRRIERLIQGTTGLQGERSPMLPPGVSVRAVQDVANCVAEAKSCGNQLASLKLAAMTEGETTGDHLPTALVNELIAISARPGSRAEALTIAALLDVVSAADNDDRASAMRMLSTARPPGDASGANNVLAVYRLLAASDAQDFPDRVERLESLAFRAVDLKYLRLAAVAFNWAALGHTRAGRLDAAIATRSQALELYASVGDTPLVAELHALVAEAYRLAGAWDEAWEHHHASFATLRSVNVPRTTHVVYAHAALTALAMDAVPLATMFQTALLENARTWNFPAAVVAAASQRARSWIASTEPHRALADIAEAREAIARMAPSAYTERVRAELTEAEATASVTVGGAGGVAAVSRAIAAFQQAGFHYRLVGAHVLLADAHAAAGDSEAAARASRAALRQWASESQAGVTDELEQPLAASLQKLSWQLADIASSAADVIGIAEAVDTGRGAHFDPVAFGRLVQQAPPEHCAMVFSDTVSAGVVAAVFRAGRGRAIALGLSRADVRRLVSEVRAHVQAGRAGAPTRLGTARARLLALADDDIRRCHTLSIVPTDDLSGLPFALLPDAQGRPLIGSVAVVLESTAAAAVAGWPDVTRRAPNEVWTLGAVEQGDSAALPAVRDELRSVASAYGTGVTTTIYNPTVVDFERAFARADVLHFAGHAVADPRRAALSHIRLAGTPGTYRLGRLRGAARGPSVVILAACQTAFEGDDQEGAVLGIARSALAAGAKSVVGTLWDVADSDVAVFSKLLHVELASGTPPPEALQRAQRAALNQESIRFATIAAFVVAGTRLGPS